MSPKSANIAVSVHSRESLDVRRFEIHEEISTLFRLDFIVLSPNHSIRFDEVVGLPASCRLDDGGGETGWTGICSHFELIAAESSGVSTYAMTIVPDLWLATQRRDYRIFQRVSEPEIVMSILREWNIEPELRIDPGAYKKRKYRVQYAESDHAFISRMLEDAGIAYFFRFRDGVTKLVLSDAPQSGEKRAQKIRFFESADRSPPGQEYVSNVRLAQRVRPGRYTMGDLDYRRPADYPLVAGASQASNEVEEHLERFHYVPGAFLFGSDSGEATPTADDKGTYRADEHEGAAIAQKRIDAKRSNAKVIRFETNAHDLSPGTVMGILDHPHADLGDDQWLLIVGRHIEGSHDGEWTHRADARSADLQFRPPLETPKPRTHGVESATVVGRQGEEIHTDEFGRVRVQFHWDRRGRRDDESSCWIPVSQPLAGGGFGGINLPRVGQEVLVDFLGGDPDRPIVVGRVYTNTQKVPYSLPDQKNKSGWKSWSTPGGGGFNEIAFEDTKGAEQFLIQAEKDLHKLVKNDESETIMGSRRVSVGGSRNTSVGSVDASVVGAKHSVTMTQPMRDAAGAYVPLPPTGTEMRDQFIKLTTGQASITMNGSNITIEAATISLMATTLNLAGSGETRLAGGDYLNMGSGRGDVQMQAPSGEIRINGGPMVKING